MKYTTVIFDLDGTLLNTAEDLTDSVNFTLAHFGYPPRTLDQVRLDTGNGSAQLIAKSLPDGASTPNFNEIVDFYNAYYAQHSAVKTAPYPGIHELLRELSHNEYKLAVVSSKPDKIVKSLVRHHFGDVISVAVGEKSSIRRKPAPDSVNKVMEELFSYTWESVFIGDSEVDIATAKNAHIDCISVSWGFRTEEILRESGAGIIVGSPGELSALL